MMLAQIREILGAEVIYGTNLDSIEIFTGCGADLMSDVLSFSKTGGLLLTGLTNVQVVRTADMAGIVAVCFVRGKRPSPEAIGLASTGGIPLLATVLPMFESCGRLYRGGLVGCSEVSD